MENDQDVKTKNKLVDLSQEKFNRKQRRQMASKMAKDERVKQKKLNMLANSPVTRKEFVGLFQSAQKIRDRLYYIDILTSSLEKLLIVKGILTEDEIKVTIKSESDKALAFKEIQDQEKNYEERLRKCIELKIDPNISIIGRQIFEDTELSYDEKIKIAEEYELTMLLAALNKNKEPQNDKEPA
jgi:hypothetical protein